jgi:hypothetical protein
VLNISEVKANEIISLKKFRSIHENVWKILLSGFNSADRHAHIIGKVIIDILDESRSIKDNRFLTIIYQSRVYAFLKQILKYFEESNERSAFLTLLLRKSSIFNKFLQ